MDIKTNKSINQNIIDILNKYLEQTIREGYILTNVKDKNTNKFRRNAIEKDIRIINELTVKITSGKHALDLLKDKGLGKKMADNIDEIINTGTLSNLKSINSEQQKEANALEELKKVKGIGEVYSKKLYYEYNIKSIEQLKNEYNKINFNFTNEMLLGIKYYDDFSEKIPRSEIDLLLPIMDNVLNKLDNNLKYEICGSYRREKDMSGDIDILVSHKKIEKMEDMKKTKENYLQLIVQELSKLNIITNIIALDIETEGTSQLFRGVCIIKSIHRQLDIHFVSNNIYYTALLHFTGSKLFNVKMRDIALKNGYTLTEHGLFEINDNGLKGKMIEINSEKDVFDILKVKYLSPKDRNI